MAERACSRTSRLPSRPWVVSHETTPARARRSSPDYQCGTTRPRCTTTCAACARLGMPCRATRPSVHRVRSAPLGQWKTRYRARRVPTVPRQSPRVPRPRQTASAPAPTIAWSHAATAGRFSMLRVTRASRALCRPLRMTSRSHRRVHSVPHTASRTASNTPVGASTTLTAPGIACRMAWNTRGGFGLTGPTCLSKRPWADLAWISRLTAPITRTSSRGSLQIRTLSSGPRCTARQCSRAGSTCLCGPRNRRKSRKISMSIVTRMPMTSVSPRILQLSVQTRHLRLS